ncbi:MAG: DNRLRE domain-containing protein [Oscillospiraceae bacterium]|jgi:hypothetical protein|nr:DNRLRE domain-containing protein [Oscillospiraceae bacterium]
MKTAKKMAISLSVVIACITGIVFGFSLFPKQEDIHFDYADLPANLITDAEFKTAGHTGFDINTYVDDYSLVYNNLDGTKTMYVFTHPINYQTKSGLLTLIDNELIYNEVDHSFSNKSSDIVFSGRLGNAGIQYDDKIISIKIPSENEPQMQEIQTLLGNRQEAIGYFINDNYTLYTFPTYLGMRIQLNISNKIPQDIFLPIDYSDYIIDDTNDFYVQFIDDNNDTKGLVYQPVIKDANGDIYRLLKGVSIESDKLVLSQEALSKMNFVYPISLEFSINAYRKKQADSSILSGLPNDNQYLDNYLYVGENQQFSHSLSLIRFESSLYKIIDASKIISATYTFSSINDKLVTVSAEQCDKEWASTKITWNTRDLFSNEIALSTNIEKKYELDITDLLKSWITGDADPHLGFQLSTKEKSTGLIFPSADNGYCSPRLIVTYEA